ncbi:DUF2218 domain-containing protein [Fulvimarina sp. MAC3]|uniref:DUF2218 domain-containing protein n=1 Tax=Fulvimarina sp. MAC3 TaxID=3148887 RepID=UPI0031FBD872
MTISSAAFKTAHGNRYKQAMAKHFGHKIAVEETEQTAILNFEMGTGTVAIVEDGLSLSAQASSGEDVATIEDVLERHLERFAFRETFPKLDWQRTEGDAGR